MPKKYVVRLSATERQILREVVKKLIGSGHKVRRAQMLLKADEAGPAWTDARIAEAFDSRTRTVENLRERFVTEVLSKSCMEKSGRNRRRQKSLAASRRLR